MVTLKPNNRSRPSVKKAPRYLNPSAVAALLTVAGCSSIPVQTQQPTGTPTYPPTNPATVQILRQVPTQANVKLGEITAEPPSTRTPLSAIEARLREAAAKLGADAVVIVVETTFTEAARTHGWWDNQLSADIGQVIVGVPIHYTRPEVAGRAHRP